MLSMIWPHDQELSPLVVMLTSKIMKKTTRCYRELHLKFTRKTSVRRSLVRLGRKKRAESTTFEVCIYGKKSLKSGFFEMYVKENVERRETERHTVNTLSEQN